MRSSAPIARAWLLAGLLGCSSPTAASDAAGADVVDASDTAETSGADAGDVDGDTDADAIDSPDSLDDAEDSGLGASDILSVTDSVPAACTGKLPEGATASEGEPCDAVGASFCAPTPRTLQFSVSIHADHGDTSCLPTDRMVCQQTETGPTWHREACNGQGEAQPCLALPAGVSSSPHG